MEPVRIPANIKGRIYRYVWQMLMLLAAWLIVGSPLPLLLLPVLLFVLLFVTSNKPSPFLPALLADTNGITDATGEVSGGLVYWHEIAAIETVNTASEKLLLLRLHDSQTYLERLPKSSRVSFAASVSHYGTPCVVAQSDIGVPVEHAAQQLADARLVFAGNGVPPVEAIRTHEWVPGVPLEQRERLPVATAPSAHWWTAVPPEDRAERPTQTVGRQNDR